MSEPLSTSAHAAIELRDIQSGDMGWVIAAHGELYAHEYGWNFCFEALVAEIGAGFLREEMARGGKAWIAWDMASNKRVGSSFLVWPEPTIAKLRLVLVTQAARGMGLGAQLTDAALNHAREQGAKKIVLWTHSCLIAARAMYAKRGFVLRSTESHADFGVPVVGEEWELAL